MSGYKIVRELGRGANSTVYLAKDTDSGELVALKELDISSDKGISRVQHEIQLLQFLSDPECQENLLCYYGYLRNGDKVYIVTEYLEGKPLNEITGNLDSVDVMLQLAEALKYLHDNGIVHRDVKPANAIVSPTGVVKLIDYDISCTTKNLPVKECKGNIAGTPHYIAPELWLKKVHTFKDYVKADIYSLGATFYHLLTGSPPFRGKDREELVRNVTDPSLDAEWPNSGNEELDELVIAMMEKDPRRRPSLEEVVEVLEGIEEWSGRRSSPLLEDTIILEEE